MTKERFDIHQHVTDKIVSGIERGAGEFHLPWHRSTGTSCARSTSTPRKPIAASTSSPCGLIPKYPGRKNFFNDDLAPAIRIVLPHGHDFRQPSRDRGGRFSLPFQCKPSSVASSSVPTIDACCA